MKTHHYFLLLFILFFFGCSSPSKNLKTTYNAEANEGMIVGTVCIEKKMYNIFTFMYCDDKPSINDYPNQKDSFTFRNSYGDFNSKNKTYYLFSISKPEGKYKFFKLKIFNNMRNDPTTIEIPLDMKFSVEKGKTTYFGELKINTQKKIYTVENQIERDRKWFAKKVPQIQF